VFKEEGQKRFAFYYLNMGRWAKSKIWMILKPYRTFHLPKTAQRNVRHNTKDEFDRLAVQGTLLFCSSLLKQLTEKFVCDFRLPPGNRREQRSSGLLGG
jgi:hypothetical protein